MRCEGAEGSVTSKAETRPLPVSDVYMVRVPPAWVRTLRETPARLYVSCRLETIVGLAPLEMSRIVIEWYAAAQTYA